jgi:hypothetical protein
MVKVELFTTSLLTHSVPKLLAVIVPDGFSTAAIGAIKDALSNGTIIIYFSFRFKMAWPFILCFEIKREGLFFTTLE